MSEIMRPILEIAVIIPGMLLAYLPVKTCLRQAPLNLDYGCFRRFWESACQEVLSVIIFRL